MEKLLGTLNILFVSPVDKKKRRGDLVGASSACASYEILNYLMLSPKVFAC